MKTRSRLLFIVVFMMIFFIVLTVYNLAQKTVMPPDNQQEQATVAVVIKAGTPLSGIANLLYDKGVIKNVKNFVLTAKLFRMTNKLKAGRYQLATNLSNYDVLKTLVAGKVTELKVSIPEGYTSRQIAGLMRRELQIDSTQFMTLVDDAAFINHLGIDSPSLEGYLYPNTYNFYWGEKEDQVITKLVTEFKHRFTDSLQTIAEQRGWSVHKVLTLASIIEGEAMIDSERPFISAVYHNRLQKRMYLQADPTIQYIIPNGPRRLLNKDLAIESPYNTYKHIGLPPGPVKNPGIKSIIAAIEPASVPYLYFVAKGDGSHIFSRSLKEHNVAKRKFDQYRLEVKRKSYAQNNKH
jgi:UPF0755 protein